MLLPYIPTEYSTKPGINKLEDENHFIYSDANPYCFHKIIDHMILLKLTKNDNIPFLPYRIDRKKPIILFQKRCSL